MVAITCRHAHLTLFKGSSLELLLSFWYPVLLMVRDAIRRVLFFMIHLEKSTVQRNDDGSGTIQEKKFLIFTATRLLLTT